MREVVLKLEVSDGWFKVWQQLFCGDGAELTRRLYEIAGKDQVLAWTIANAVRLPNIRKPEHAGYLSRQLQELSRQVGGDPDAIARWRIVHALSAFGDTEYAAEVVRERLDDKREYIWVRYGAGRSLVEMAATQTGARRQELLGWLAASTQGIAAAVPQAEGESRETLLRILREIGRSVLYQNVRHPDDWVDAVTPLVEKVSLLIQGHPRYGQRWRDEVLAPFLKGEWVGKAPSVATVERMRRNGVHLPDAQPPDNAPPLPPASV